MVLTRTIANKTLKGHKLLLLAPTPPPPTTLTSLHARFPDLEITTHQQTAAEKRDKTPLPDRCWEGVTVLLTTTVLPTLGQAARLRYVQLWSAGAEFLREEPVFRDTDVVFCSANGVHGPQISEWVIATFLALNHNIPKYLQQQREARWSRIEETTEDAVGKRVGILGYGSIGRQVARVSKAMDMDVHAYTLHPRTTPESRRDDSYVPPGLGDPEGILPSKWFSGGSKADLHAFLGSDLDLLVVSLPLTPQTENLISKPEFAILGKKKTFLTNIARGPIVNTEDLMEALNGDVIRGAAVDVTDPEPLPDGHPLWSAKNLIVTPHVSGGSTAYEKRVYEILEFNLVKFSEGKELTNRVSRKDGY